MISDAKFLIREKNGVRKHRELNKEVRTRGSSKVRMYESGNVRRCERPGEVVG
jgi:Holliday junction resolvase